MRLDDALKQSFVLEILPGAAMLMAAGYLIRDGEAMATQVRRTGESGAEPLARQAVRLDESMRPWRGFGLTPADALPPSMRSPEAVEFIQGALAWMEALGGERNAEWDARTEAATAPPVGRRRKPVALIRR